MKNVKFIYNSKLVRFMNWVTHLFRGDYNTYAVTLGHTVRFRNHEGTIPDCTYKHELRHVQQLEQSGFLVFYLRYIWYILKYGYTRNPYEVDARNVGGC